MRILAVTEGVYGNRIVSTIGSNAPADWVISSWHPPVINEPVVDEPEIYLPASLPAADLILCLGERPQVAQLLPALVRLTGARGVIASIDHSAWIPAGLQNQLRRELAASGVTIVFPEPLCSLDVSTAGFGEKLQPYTSEVISEFARFFGRPVLEVQLDGDGKIVHTMVKRGAPCGSTQYTAGRIKGMAAASAIPTAGLMCLHYPCLASMKFEQTESGVDTIMHNSGRIFNEGLQKALDENSKKHG